MELLDNPDFSSEYSRETGDIDEFNPKLIPLQRDSYLGEFLLWSESVLGIDVRSHFINLLMRVCFAIVRRHL